MQLVQLQQHTLNAQMIQRAQILQMSTQELEQYLEAVSLENPLIEPVEHEPEYQRLEKQDGLTSRLDWLEENDPQNQCYKRVREEEWDPLACVGTLGGLEETLECVLNRQLERLKLPKKQASLIHGLISYLDDDGYLRDSIQELSEQLGASVFEIKEAVHILQNMEPAGVAAGNLSECLCLQLKRMDESEIAMEIVCKYLKELAGGQIKTIAHALGQSQESVLSAVQQIQKLEPRPGSMFRTGEQMSYLYPDVMVEEQEGAFILHETRRKQTSVHLNQYYYHMMRETKDVETRKYLEDRLRQAEQIQKAVLQRQNLLLHCAELILMYQEDFFRKGPEYLRPLLLTHVAEELQVDISTISRAVREKYLQCTRGIYPFRYFFGQSTEGNTKQEGRSVSAIMAVLKRLIAQEDPTHPLSDQQLGQLLEKEGCYVSRRTVAKYRDALKIPAAKSRKLGLWR